MAKNDKWNGFIEDKIPEKEDMEMSWMIPFWAIFTECVIELDSKHIISNVRHRSGSGMLMTEYVGKSFIDMSSKNDKETVTQKLNQLKDSVVPYLRFQVLSKNGRYYRWTLVPIYEFSKYRGCRGVAVDVTDQTIKEITLSWQSAVIEDGRDFVRIYDTDGKPMYTNPGAYKMLGLDPEKEIPPSYEMYSPEHYVEVHTKGIQALKKHNYWNSWGELARADGVLVPIEHTMFTIHNDFGEIMLYVSVIRDISVFVEHEKSLDEARKAAIAANEAKGMFLSKMSHEIRTPMNTIIGMINIGLDTDVTDKKNHCFEVARDAAEHLLSLINDILDMSKIEADKLDLLYEVFDLNHMLTKIKNIMNFSSSKKNIDFSIRSGSEIPDYINGDEMRLTQVIVNLLANAVKFTPENGKVTLGITRVGGTGDEIELKFEVEDNGIGISDEQQSHLFVSFAQADASISQKYGGTGLGLTLSKQLVELMGGQISVESKLGKGSKFFFTFKTKAINKVSDSKEDKGLSKEAQSKPVNEYDFEKFTILIAEDIDINKEIISAVLEETHVNIDFASNGLIAVSTFKENPDKYDLILMDLNMPEMDGFEATRSIRSLGTVKSKMIPIIAMTANVFKEDIEKCMEAGMNDHTSKPIEASKLFEKLKKHLDVVAK